MRRGVLAPGRHLISETPFGAALALEWTGQRPDSTIGPEIDALIAEVEVWFEPVAVYEGVVVPTPKEVFGWDSGADGTK